jgi:hypothetical protein
MGHLVPPTNTAKTLPLLYRAGCNHLLGLGEDNPVGFATEAVRLFQIMADDAEIQSNPVQKENRLWVPQHAKNGLEDAKRRVAEAGEDGSTGDDDE